MTKEIKSIPATLYIKIFCKIEEVENPHFLTNKENIFGNRYEIKSIIIRTILISEKDKSTIEYTLTEPVDLEKNRNPQVYETTTIVITGCGTIYT